MIVRRTFRIASLAFALLFCGTSLAPVFAELPAARLFTIAPAGGKVGATLDITATGKDLDAATQMRFSDPGISAVLKSANTFTVKIATNVPPGLYDLWIVGKFGPSNPRIFAVGALNEVTATNANHSFTNAQTIVLGSLINGQTTANEIDYFKFSAQKGQCVVIECLAAQMDSRLEPIIALRDDTGHELARSRSTASLNYEIPTDGTFFLGLHDSLYQGGPEFFYRMSVGLFPQIRSMQPIKMESEGNFKFALSGHNLPGAEKETNGLEHSEIILSSTNTALRKAPFESPASAALNFFEYVAHNDQGVSEPARFKFPGAPLVVSSQTNQTAETAQPIVPPCAIVGEFDSNRKSRWFTFDAKKGDTYWFELVSQRFGFASDPLLVVQQAAKSGKGSDVLELNDVDENIGGVEFNTKSRDPHGRFEAKEDGTFRIELKDLFTRNRGSTPTQYQLRIDKPRPDFRLVAMPASPPPLQKDSKEVPIMTTLLRRNGTISLKVFAFRREGFDGPISIFLEGLPKGVTALPAKIDQGKNVTLVLIHAGNEIEAASIPIKVRGEAEIGGTKVNHEARFATLTWPVADYSSEPVRSRECSEYLLGTIAEPEPIRMISNPEKTWEGVSTGKVNISLIVERSAEFKIDTFNVTPIGVSALDNLKEFEINATATNVVYEIDLAQQKLAPGDYHFALRGYAKGKRTKPPGPDPEYTVYSSPIALKVSAPSTNAPAK